MQVMSAIVEAAQSIMGAGEAPDQAQETMENC